jgi:hypothetical protein
VAAEEEKRESLRKKLRSKFPTLLAGGTATITVATLSRFFDVTGTIIGTLAASILTGSLATTYEHAQARAAERVKHMREIRNKKVVTADDWQYLYREEQKPRLEIPYKRIAMLSAVLIAMCIAAATGVELASHKPLAVTGGSVAPVQPKATPMPTYSPEVTPSYTYSTQPSPSYTSSPTPTPTASPTLTPTPSVTVIPSPTPSVTP